MTEQLRVEVGTLEGSYHKLVDKQTEMINGLITKQGEVLDNRLGIAHGQPPASGSAPQALRRPNWNQVRLDYESKKRKEFWEQRIAEVEARDNQKAVQKPEVDGTTGSE
jgi:hypothetical protein